MTSQGRNDANYLQGICFVAVKWHIRFEFLFKTEIKIFAHI